MITTEPQYLNWIAAYVARHGGDVRYQCQSGITEMRKVFPELREARGYLVDARNNFVDADFKDEHGHALYPVGGPAHWWCVSPDGSVVDPTAVQFDIPSKFRQYVEHDDAKHGLLPKGKCPNCGCFRYSANLCDDAECVADFEKYLKVSVAEMNEKYGSNSR